MVGGGNGLIFRNMRFDNCNIFGIYFTWWNFVSPSYPVATNILIENSWFEEPLRRLRLLRRPLRRLHGCLPRHHRPQQLLDRAAQHRRQPQNQRQLHRQRRPAPARANARAASTTATTSGTAPAAAAPTRTHPAASSTPAASTSTSPPAAPPSTPATPTTTQTPTSTGKAAPSAAPPTPEQTNALDLSTASSAGAFSSTASSAGALCHFQTELERFLVIVVRFQEVETSWPTDAAEDDAEVGAST